MAPKAITPQRAQAMDELLKSHTEFRRAYKRHQTLESQLEEIDRHPYLTKDEELRRKQLQKEKLLEKDRMESILRGHAGATAA